MAEHADHVIIGAGFAGAATAYHLTARGARDVVVLEAEPRAGVHASGKNAALCFQLIADRDEARLAVEGTRVYASPPADLAERPLLARRGSLLIASATGHAALDDALEEASELGIAAALVSRAEAVGVVPLLDRSPFTAALHCADDGVVDIVRLLDGYLKAAAARGVRIRFGEPVTAIGVAGGRVHSVTTARGTIFTPSVVDAAGGWAAEVGRLAGVDTGTIAPRRRHIYELTAESAIDPEWPFVWHAEIDAYFRPERGGMLASACDATPHPPQAPDVDAAAEAELRAKLGEAFPGLGDFRVVAARACLRTFSADERFMIGPDPELGGFFWVAALGGHGMSTSYAVGRLAADAILGRPSLELERFSPGRFRR